MDVKQLSEEFPRQAVHWRVQGKPFQRNGRFSAMALAYIDARDVMDRLDAVCGPDGWQDEYEVHGNGLIVCRLGVRSSDGWIWKSDGAGETAVEGKKGGMSDALKRAAVKWGVGRYLYRLDSPLVRCEVKQKGNDHQWKRWIEDPWGKVKTTTYQQAEDSQREAAFEAAILSAINSISNEPDMEGLHAFWVDFQKQNRGVASDKRVIDAKEKRKEELLSADVRKNMEQHKHYKRSQTEIEAVQ